MPDTDVPWWSDGVLHVGSTTYPMPSEPEIAFRGGTTLVSFRKPVYRVIRGDGPLRPLPAGHPYASDPVISSDGTHVAWVETVASHPLPNVSGLSASRLDLLLVDYDLEGGRVSASLPQTADVECCEGDAVGVPQIQGYTDDGRLVLYDTDRNPPALWDPRQGTITVAEVGADGASMGGVPAWPGGIAYSGPDSSGPATLVRVDGSGHFSSTRQVPQASDGSWNEDGTIYAYDLYPEAVSFVGPDGGEPARLPLPESTDEWRIAAWESNDTLLLVSRRKRTNELARCDVVALTCEPVADVPAMGPLVLPQSG
ncbi:hypothetical protein [Nocardioides sp. URHA0020]|uniref:hypothetical protein n=1 Tax=Nocardioides sp. URHA0020 TaxID=1380392 RepID=UPI00048C654D|nr:hypothetical protein [Nocardioides sp. URHA0020]